MKIGYLNAFKDNYIWFIQENEELIVIDPGESEVILQYIKNHDLNLKSILLTHDHHDHIGGVEKLLQHFDVPTYGMCPIAQCQLKNNDIIQLSSKITGKILATPGHTYTSICYLLDIMDKQHLFCGDTLFAAGCGRVFTGDFQAMFQSLNQLKALDSNCLIYPGHEYTVQNLKFAQFVEPNNILITERIERESMKFEALGCTLPVTMAIEQKTNPFFRCDDIDFVRSFSKVVNQNINKGFDCFVKLRELKNNFAA